MTSDKLLIPRNIKLRKYNQEELTIFIIMKSSGFIYYHELFYGKKGWINVFSNVDKKGYQIFIICQKNTGNEMYQFKINLGDAKNDNDLFSTCLMDTKKASEFLSDMYFLIKTCGMNTFMNDINYLLGKKIK